MPSFSYRGISEQGHAVAGDASAVSAEALAHELAQRGVCVRSIRPLRASLIVPWTGVRPESVLLLVQEMVAMLRAGLRVSEVLAHVSDRPGQPALQRALVQVEADVRRGAGLADACARQPEVFDPLFMAALRVGEQTGDLVSALTRYREALKRRIALSRQLSQAFAYPIFLVLTLALVLVLLFALVLPRFVEMYAGAGIELPWATRLLMEMVHEAPLYGAIAAALCVALWGGYRRWTASEAGKVARDAGLNRVPWLRNLLECHGTAQMGSTLSALLASGMPLVEALHATAEVLRDRARAARLAEAADLVVQGRPLAESLIAGSLVPPAAAKMIAAGELSGSLEGVLADAATYFEELFAFRVQRAAGLIEPVLMLFMGVLLGGVIVVMYLPVFNMANVIQ